MYDGPTKRPVLSVDEIVRLHPTGCWNRRCKRLKSFRLRWPRPGRRMRHRGDVPQHRPGLVEPGQHTVPAAQDLGSRGRHLDPADRPLAEGDRRPGRDQARAGPRHRPRPHDPRRGRRRSGRKVGGQGSANGSGEKPGAPVRRRPFHRLIQRHLAPTATAWWPARMSIWPTISCSC